MLHMKNQMNVMCVVSFFLIFLFSMHTFAQEVVVDSEDGTGVEIVGYWMNSTSNHGYHGLNYKHDRDEDKGNKSVKWIPSLPVSGDYEVFLWWTEDPERASNAPVDIYHNGVTTTVYVNQRINGQQWYSLGTYNFSAGTSGWVKIRTNATDGYVIADAVRFYCVGGGGDTSPPVISNINATNITTSSATITWNTDEPSTSHVDYGTTTSYGNTEGNGFLVTNHSVGLAGLSPNTTYHYRVRSTDASNNEAVSSDGTFTTSQSGGGTGEWIPSGNDIYYNTGKVGIGTTAPGHTLDVNGTARLGSTTNGILVNGLTTTITDLLNISYATGNVYSTIRGPVNRVLRIDLPGNETEDGLHIRGSQNSGSTYPYDVAFFSSSGKVGIGTTSPSEKLSVNGKIKTKEIIVTETGWSDYVFEDGYPLLSLEQVEQHIKANKHLPDIPSAQEVKEKGLSVGEMQTKLLQKIEELTLYIIQQQERIKKLEEEAMGKGQ